MHYNTIIKFWFDETPPRLWYQKDPQFDTLIQERFISYHNAAIRCELSLWRQIPIGRLAEIIILDQFSRNIYRDTEKAFMYDNQALCLAQTAIDQSDHTVLDQNQKAFLYLPFMHSESSLIHETAVKLFSEPGLESNLAFELKHKAIIDRFGRYPHRNAILGRTSTQEEILFLKTPGSSF